MNTDNKPLISILLVSWNSGNYLHRCLKALSLQTLNDFEIILIDNGSTDDSLKELSMRWPNLNLQLKCLTENRGFAFANNLGARLARGEWLALLNTDAFPEPNWLDNLLLAAKQNPEYSFFSSRQIQANNPNILDGAGDAYHISGLAWKRFLGYPVNGYGLETAEVFSSCGAAALFRREAFLDVNGFDEDFFSYMEDVDLGFRLRLRGNRCLYVAEAVVQHIGSATLGVTSDFALYHYHRNLIWSFIQNMPSGLLWKYFFPHLVANVLYVANYTARGRGKIMWKAKVDAIRGLSRAWLKRRELQARKNVSDKNLEKVMERGWLQPYLLGYNLRKTLRNYKP
jgi:GT2 family glycosyltransferase